MRSLPVLTIGNVQSSLPIVQGGMGGGISLSGLASAVIENGGIGVLTSVGTGLYESDYNVNRRDADRRSLYKEIRAVKEKTKGPLGVNIMMAISDSDGLIQTSIEAHADILFMGAGLPLSLPEEAVQAYKEGNIELVPIVSSAKAFELICKAWKRRYNIVPSAVVVEGPLAGGHLGFHRSQIDNPDFTLERLVSQIIPLTRAIEHPSGNPVPLIAGGGIYTKEDIGRMFELGASAVQMATRFVATKECDASPEFKAAYVAAQEKDIMIIESPLGLPGRAIRNEFLAAVDRGKRVPIKCDWKCLKTCDPTKVPYCIGNALINAKMGRLNEGFAFAGANVARIDRITTVRELIAELFG
jgi:nitronate monooxygenase